MIVYKTPLAKRIEQVNSINSDFLNIFEIFINDYFEALSKISKTQNFMNIFDTNVYYITSDQATIFAEIQELSDELLTQKDNILYKTFVYPFIVLENEKENFNGTIHKNTKNI